MSSQSVKTTKQEAEKHSIITSKSMSRLFVTFLGYFAPLMPLHYRTLLDRFSVFVFHILSRQTKMAVQNPSVHRMASKRRVKACGNSLERQVLLVLFVVKKVATENHCFYN